MSDNLPQAVAETAAAANALPENMKDKVKPVVVPASQAAPIKPEVKKWGLQLEHERIETLRGVVYKMQKSVQALQGDLIGVRKILERHQHTANGDVALPLGEAMPPMSPSIDVDQIG
jgi:hypothetical protein